jgi:NADPH2:quinone reductase
MITSLDGPGAVGIADVPEPTGDDDHVVVDVHAAGVAFPDVLQTRGRYQIKPELPFIPGTEIAGVVHSAPAGSGFSPGDRVAAFPGLGGFAERAAVETDQVFPLPAGVTLVEGAGLPMNALTVHFALAHRCRPAPGETVLVHGAAGGVGTAAVQFAHALGNRVIAVASTREKQEIALRAGADDAIGVDGFLDAVRELTGGRGVDIVVDPVGGDRFTDSLRCLASDGRLLVVGFTGGEIPTVKVNRLLLNNISVVGVGWGAYWTRHPGYLHRQWDELLPMIGSGALTPIVGATFPLEQTSAALVQMDGRGALGKIVIEVR